jgi:hypothetical protein
MSFSRINVLFLSLCVLFFCYSNAYSQDFDKVQISTIKVAEITMGSPIKGQVKRKNTSPYKKNG